MRWEGSQLHTNERGRCIVLLYENFLAAMKDQRLIPALICAQGSEIKPTGREEVIAKSSIVHCITFLQLFAQSKKRPALKR